VVWPHFEQINQPGAIYRLRFSGEEVFNAATIEVSP
jgi:hypothetical protein